MKVHPPGGYTYLFPMRRLKSAACPGWYNAKGVRTQVQENDLYKRKHKHKTKPMRAENITNKYKTTT